MASRSRKSPVSAAIEIQIADIQLALTVRRALEAVDLVHDDGQLDKVPLKANPRLRAAWACYHYRGAKALDIEVNPFARRTSFNVLEEIAHFLDHQALGTRGFGFASVDHEMLDEWRTAVRRSSPVKKLQKLASKEKDALGARLREASGLHEIFARSYSQYIAVKSNDEVLLDQLKGEREWLYGDILHWNDQQFEPIMKALDQLFSVLDWK